MRVSIALLLAVLAVASVKAQNSANCSGYTTCSECVQWQPCGWCTQTNTCQSGTPVGSPTCRVPYWDWLAEQCNATVPPAPTPTSASVCSPHTDCISCTSVYPCGWCTTTNTCQVGTASGSSSCVAPYWDWTQSQCNAVPTPPPTTNPTTSSPSGSICPNTLSCYQCTTLEGCGFCTVGGCMAGSASGSTTGCSGTWEYNRTQCTMTYAPTAGPTTVAPSTLPPSPTAECPNTFSCQKCTLLEGCEYCSTTGCISQGASCSGTVVMNFTSCPSS